MGNKTLLEYIKSIIGHIGWKLFLWSIEMTGEQYREEIYQQEKLFKEQPNDRR